ncbi:ribose 5-phosphate isomerase B [bacterium]|nr:ribose 5-phosphate isomerase B [bacterium]
MKIVLASDHAGFSLKQIIKKHLENKKHSVEDVGCLSNDRCDYPDFGKRGARLVVGDNADRGIFVCGSGIGICMAANRIKGARAAVIRDKLDAEMCRKHNDANIACFGERVSNNIEVVKGLVDVFLSTEFEGGRHQGRVEKLDVE